MTINLVFRCLRGTFGPFRKFFLVAFSSHPEQLATLYGHDGSGRNFEDME